MKWEAIETEEDYNKAIIRLVEIFHAEPNTPEDEELGLSIILIKDYEDKNHPIPEFDVLENIKNGLEEMKQFKKGNLKTTPAKDFLNEL